MILQNLFFFFLEFDFLARKRLISPFLIINNNNTAIISKLRRENYNIENLNILRLFWLPCVIVTNYTCVQLFHEWLQGH